MPHRVAIIGQSNSILRDGYAGQLHRSGLVRIGRTGRLGASPSILLPFFGTPAFFAGHDFCVIDTAVVDQGFLWAGVVDPYSITMWLAAGIRAARAAGCMPILLFIPHQATVPDPARPPQLSFLQQLYHAAALHNGAVCFDMTGHLAALARTDPDRFAAAYADADHLSESMAGELTAQLVHLMDRLAARERRRGRIGNAAVFDRIRLVDHLAGVRAVARSSSLYADDFVVLDAEQPAVDVPVGGVPRVHGLLLNRPAAAGRLAIEGDGRIVRALGTVPDSDLGFVAQLTPLVGRVGDRSGRLRLALEEPLGPVTEPTWQAQPSDSSCAEIAELLVERDGAAPPVDGPLPPADLQFPQWHSGE